MSDIARFIFGFKRFQKEYFCADSKVFEGLRVEQKPRALLIGCSDSRVDPSLLTDCAPGELFVVRNVANLVPPCDNDGGHHGVSAAVEFAVRSLEVEHIIVLGHCNCGGIKALLREGDRGRNSGFIDSWVNIAAKARELVLNDLAGHEPQVQERACEQGAILISLDNLLSFPWVRERVEAGKLYLHGWYFDFESGELFSYLPETKAFELLVPRCLE
ncbi:carbonic anhydrase [Solidesulfovibrio carbinolicus]|uniref:Carbonic anhydrase n=1 Tax=Solidesulfovibrio carbinolicus TaxID=296842 RepID=A0A4P6HIE0_9BACT|nr:carbonic anhydrase [Solidesulfovibrio carbinolicus]QAZ66144.1 carbonic anhydrase [Solidesulfovibrio carbinolicus]